MTHVVIRHGEIPNGDASPRVDKPLRWAIDTQSRRVVHVSMLKRQQKGLACGCVCPGCGEQLEAVNAGRDPSHFLRPNTRGQFFRHGRGHQKDNCLLLAARFAALQLLCEQGEIELPAAKRSVTVQGVTGTFYSGDYARSRAAVRVRERIGIDAQSARLTLKDGKVVLLQLESSFHATDDERYDGVITIRVNDPAIASWSAEDILSQIRLGGELACWGRHWDDGQAEFDAHERAQRQANEALDLDAADDSAFKHLTAAQRSESILHRAIKDILAEASSISVPRYAGSETATSSNGTVLAENFSIEGGPLGLTDVRLEHHLGNMVPDVYCEAHGSSTSFPLMIEVIVTHMVDEQKLTKIRERGLACLAVDISRLQLQGTMTITRLRSEVLLNPQIKAWLFDPRLEALRAMAKEKLRQRIEKAERPIRAREKFLASLYAKDSLQLPYFALGAVLEYARDAERGIEAQCRIDLEAIGLILRNGKWGIQQPGLLLAPDGVLRALSAIRSDAHDPASDRGVAVAHLTHFVSDAALRSYISLLLIAFKTYAPALNHEQRQYYKQIHQRVSHSLERLEYGFARSRQFDSLITTLFPEMKEPLEHPLGTAAHIRELSKQKTLALAEEQKHREARERAEAARHAREEELREIQAAIDRLSSISWEAPVGFMVDAEQALTTSSVKNIAKSMQYHNVNTAEVLRSAFVARAQGTNLTDWIHSLSPTSTEQIHCWLTVVRAAWMIIDRPRS
ncbi:hypothetical protein AB4142_26655 [Variovorax sp. 2RAF20]